MADLQKTVSIIFEGDTSKATAAVASLEKSLGGVGAEAGTAAPKVDDLANSADALGKTEGSILSVSNAFKALAGSLVAKAFLDANVEAEKFDKAMTLLKGSSEAAAQEFVYISGVANTLGTNLFATAGAYTQLTAATRGTALEGEGTREIFEAVAKAMSSLGKSSADTEGALLAISQIVSKGNVSLEELRGQLGERLPGAFGIAAKSMGLTTAELDKLVSSGKLTAEEFLPRFAAGLREAFGDTTYVEGYTAAFNRLQTAISQAFIDFGSTGVFDALTKGVEVATATVVGAITAFDLFGKALGTIFAALNGLSTGTFGDLGGELSTLLDDAANKVRGARDAMLGLNDATEKTANTTQAAGGSINLFATDAAKYLAAADVSAAGLKKTLDGVSSNEALAKVAADIVTAYAKGTITSEEFAAATTQLDEAQARLAGTLPKTTETTKATADELARQAKETAKAEEAAKAYQLELEKLASNERIKNIEANVSLNIAQLEADTERVIRAFDSIDNTVSTTGESLGDLFGLLGDFDGLNFEARDILRDQLDTQNKRQQDALDLQAKLVEAQIANIRAQTAALQKGDSLIQIDGAGLQPHLEAFMWEILRTIQVRVNQDGLAMLLGTP